MTYCPRCGHALPPHAHRRAVLFSDRAHPVVVLAPATGYEITPAGRQALHSAPERAA